MAKVIVSVKMLNKFKIVQKKKKKKKVKKKKKKKNAQARETRGKLHQGN